MKNIYEITRSFTTEASRFVKYWNSYSSFTRVNGVWYGFALPVYNSSIPYNTVY